MSLYEHTLIVKQDISTPELEKIEKKYKDIITKTEGEVIKVEKWGLLSFAKKIKAYNKGYERARTVLTEKIDDLHKLAKALLTYETLSGEEIENLINKNIYPSNKEDLKDEDEDKGSALSSMGLKPKIVH